MRKNCVILACIILITASCGLSSSENEKTETNFPLRQSSVIQVDHDIEKMAITDTWIAITTPNKLTAMDISTNTVIWTLDNFLLDKDSDLQITDNTLFATTYGEVLAVNESGDRKSINLKPSTDDIVQLVAIYNNYLYLIRGANWNLEVYDIAKNTYLWEVWVGRGQTDVFYDSQTGIVYVITPRSITAYENLSGELLWQQQTNIKHSSFNSGVLYLCEGTSSNKTYTFIALDVGDQKELWKKDFVLESGEEVYQLSVIQNMVIATTRYGYFAMDKNDGDQMWRTDINDIFYNEPVEFNGILYAKGSSGKIYAISTDDGSVIGYNMIEKNPRFQSRYDASQRVFKLDNGIAVNTNKAILIFRQK
jgi:outer membrane protein assembly factor BamB